MFKMYQDLGADDSGVDADDDVESVCDDIRQQVSHMQGLPPICMTVADWSHVLDFRKFV